MNEALRQLKVELTEAAKIPEVQARHKATLAAEFALSVVLGQNFDGEGEIYAS